ncbi:MAG: hypothetical protein KGQ41_09525, partial [Alphaproteobacteria bacterium]|nr:hypothetical protein [Alphaproteobacteria bacterium]
PHYAPSLDASSLLAGNTTGNATPRGGHSPALVEAFTQYFSDEQVWNIVSQGHTPLPQNEQMRAMVSHVLDKMREKYQAENPAGSASSFASFEHFCLDDDDGIRTAALSGKYNNIASTAAQEFLSANPPIAKPSERLEGEEDSAEVSGEGPTEPKGIKDVAADDESSSFHSIFGTLSKEEVALAHRAKLKGEFLPLQAPSTIKMISAIRGGFENQPSVQNALLAQKPADAEFEPWRESEAGQKAARDAFYKNSLLFPASENSLVGFHACSIEQRWTLTNPHSMWNWKEANLVFMDANGTGYSDNGRGVDVRLQPARKDAKGNTVPAEKFSAHHAMNMTGLFIAGRCRPMPDGKKQLVPINIRATGIGSPARLREIREMLIMSALVQSKKAGVVPELMELRGPGGFWPNPIEELDFKKLRSGTAYAKMAQYLGEDELKELVDAYNDRKKPQVSLEDAPAATAADDKTKPTASEIAFARKGADNTGDGTPIAAKATPPAAKQRDRRLDSSAPSHPAL